MLRNFVGKTLEGVQAALTVDEGVVDMEPSRLTLSFGEGSEVSLLPSSDGESIRVSRRPRSPVPESETELEVLEQDQTEEPQWLPFVGKVCEDVLEVRDTTIGSKGTWCGVEFQFEGGATLSCFNWGDELLCTVPPEDTGFLERSSVQRKDERSGGRGEGRSGSEGDQGSDADGGKKGARAEGDEKSSEGGSGSGKRKRKRKRRRRRSRGGEEEE